MNLLFYYTFFFYISYTLKHFIHTHTHTQPQPQPQPHTFFKIILLHTYNIPPKEIYAVKPFYTLTHSQKKNLNHFYAHSLLHTCNYFFSISLSLFLCT